MTDGREKKYQKMQKMLFQVPILLPILKIFSPNELAKKFAVLTQNCLLILSKNGFPEIARF
jgi:hypothetical protein